MQNPYNRYCYLLPNFNHPLLSPVQLERYETSVQDRGAALDNCWGFVDGTVRPLCRPQYHKRFLYNGHKRLHSIKFQSVVNPTCLIANLWVLCKDEDTTVLSWKRPNC